MRRSEKTMSARAVRASERAVGRALGEGGVVEEDVGAGDEVGGARGHRPGVARAGADGVDDPLAPASAPARSRISRAPAASIRSAHWRPAAAPSAAEPVT